MSLSATISWEADDRCRQKLLQSFGDVDFTLADFVDHTRGHGKPAIEQANYVAWFSFFRQHNVCFLAVPYVCSACMWLKFYVCSD